MILASASVAYAIGFDTEEVYNSVFVIYSGNSLGSGFAIGENCIITNAHVISDRYDVQVKTYSGEVQDAYVVMMDDRLDIAVLGVDGASYRPLQVADLSKISVGDDVFAIGAPNSLAFTLTKGVVSSKERYVNSQRYIQTDAAINSGNSGGPLLNDAGEVIGVNSYKMSDSEGLGLAIPIDVVVTYLETGELETDTHGNVVAPVPEQPKLELPSVDQTDNAAVARYAAQLRLAEQKAAILTVVLAASVFLNLILLIVLLVGRKKKLAVPPDPSERTDFDIELFD